MNTTTNDADVFGGPPKLLLINCNFGLGIDGGFRHSAFVGNKRVATVRLSAIMTETDNLEGFRKTPNEFMRWLLNGN